MLFRLVLCLACLAFSAEAQKATLVPADPVYLPGVGDSNSPMHWSAGKLFVYNSDGQPVRSEGDALESLRYARAIPLDNPAVAHWWLEATYRDTDGTIYGWYHHEIYNYCPIIDVRYMGVPVIGAVISKDNGRTFQDLGFVLIDGATPNCEAKNGYFAGGHGDFTVILDRDKKNFYFFFSAYGGSAAQQGVAVARMAFEDRNAPVGNVWKFHHGGWESPGIEGELTPIFTVKTPWDSEFTDALWGPSVHYNRELDEFVMLMNHACCQPDWPAEGIYVSFNRSLRDPKGWSAPERLLDGGGWYPMAVGLDPGDTDKDGGARMRFFMGSDSNYEIIFQKGQEGVAPLQDAPKGKRRNVGTRRRRN